jgi:hypothetical protein
MKALQRLEGGFNKMKIRTDFVTNSSSSSWIYLSSVIPAAAAVAGIAGNAVYAGIAGSSSGSTAAQQSPSVRGSRILDGAEAIRWLQDNEMLDGGKLNDKFWGDFYNEGDPSCSLQAIAGNWRTENRDFPIGRITIVVRDTGEVKGTRSPVKDETRDGEMERGRDQEGGSVDLLGQQDPVPGVNGALEAEPDITPETVELDVEPEVETEAAELEAEPEVEGPGPQGEETFQNEGSSEDVKEDEPVSDSEEDTKPPQDPPQTLEGLLGVMPDEAVESKPEVEETQKPEELQEEKLSDLAKDPLDLAAWEEKLNQNIAERFSDKPAQRESLANINRTFQLQVVDPGGQTETIYLELLDGKATVSRETTASEFAVSVDVQKNLLDKLLANMEKPPESAAKDIAKSLENVEKPAPIDPMDLLKGMENFKYDKDAVMQLLDIFEADLYKRAFELYDLTRRGRDLLGF